MINLSSVRVIDLSLPLDEYTPPYPGDPHFKKKQFLFSDNDIVNAFNFSTSTQLGTHIQASFYTNLNGKKLSEIPIKRFFGEAIIVDVKLGEIPHTQIETICKLRNLPSKIIFRSNCKVNITIDDLEHDKLPYLSLKSATLLFKTGFNFFGSDGPCISKYPDYESKKYLCKHDVILLDNLTNLNNISKERIFLIALPLKLQETEGAPCRVIALEEK